MEDAAASAGGVERQFMFDSVIQGKAENVEKFLATYPAFNVDIEDKYGETPLYLAAQHGDLCIISLLIEHGADVNKAKQDGSTPLLIAVDRGHEEAVGLLMAFNADVNAASNVFGCSPLFYAASRGYVVSARLLLHGGADVHFSNRHRSTALHEACWNGRLEVCRVLLEHGSDVVAVDKRGNTPLHAALHGGSAPLTRLLLQQEGADVNAQNCRGDTPLHIAARLGRGGLFEGMLQVAWPGDVHVQNHEGETPLSALLSPEPGGSYLHAAVKRGLPVLLGVLLEESDAGAVALRNSKGNSLAHLVATCSDRVTALAMLTQLVERGRQGATSGVDLGGQNHNGDTPVALAALYKHTPLVRVLLENGVSVNTLNVRKWSPLYYAVMNADADMVETLLEGGADVKLDTQVPLLNRAAAGGALEVVAMLLDKGAPVDAVSSNNSSALYAAALAGHAEIVNLLLSHKADVNAGTPPPLVAALASLTTNPSAAASLLLRTGAVSQDSLDNGLGEAAKRGDAEMVDQLLSLGARYTVGLDEAGSTALDLASTPQCIELLTRKKNSDELVAAEEEAATVHKKPGKKKKKKKKKKNTQSSGARGNGNGNGVPKGKQQQDRKRFPSPPVLDNFSDPDDMDPFDIPSVASPV